MKKIFFTLFVLVASVFYSVSQEKYTISGYVKDATNGETIIGANVYIDGTTTGTTSNVYGFYSLSLPKGNYSIAYSFVSYKKIIKPIELNANITISVEMETDDKTLTEVVISSEREDKNVKSQEMSVNKLDIKTIQKIPALLGEVDVIRSIQLLPGITTVGEGATGFNVRGGNIDQNLVLLDEAPVFNSSHLFGFFSVFNPDAVKDIKLVKGGIPSQYGGRLSSLLDIRMKEGNSKKLELNGGIGSIFSRFSLETPIIKDKMSFIIAARRSYIDVLAKPFLPDELKGSKFSFYDLTAKINYRINEKNNVFLSGYLGRDVFGGPSFGFNWGNTTATARWNHLFNEKLFMNATAFYSNYDYVLKFSDDENDQGFDWNAKIINNSIKPDFTYYINPLNTLRFGAQAILYKFQPGNAVVTSGDIKNNISIPNQHALENALYISNEQKVNEKLSFEYGLRYSWFTFMGEGNAYTYRDTTSGIRKLLASEKKYDSFEPIKTYGNLEPRASVKYELNDVSSVKASYNRMAQYLHLVSNTAAASPLDIWTPSTNNIKPQLADQVAVGYFRNLKDNMFETSVEVFYKAMQNQLDYVPNANLLLNNYLEADLIQGIGRAYGAEFFVKKSKGKWNGWVSYTLSRTERKVEGISKNEWFLNRFDRTHVINTVLTYDMNKRWSFAANFTFQSGTPGTFPTSRLEMQGYIIPHNTTELRNNFRIPAYHRLDFSATYQSKKNDTRRWQGNWVFGAYNIYNRQNPYSIYFRTNKDNSTKTEAVRIAIIGSIIPSVTYNFKF
ncbi:MAG: TonB-dependent receptor [Bacteroidetes bacterium]|nr:TonB-dependent receptor [Bacteroidota bacterium]